MANADIADALEELGVLYELDGQSALGLYKKYLGERAAEMRRDVSRIPAAERSQRGAAMLGGQYPGAIAETRGPVVSGADRLGRRLRGIARPGRRLGTFRSGSRLVGSVPVAST